MKKQLQKFFKTKANSINEEKYQATFVISDESVDRQGEVIKQDGWDLENFKKNPVILFGHDSWELPVGKAVDIYTEGDKTYATIEFAVEIYDKAKTIWEMVKAGILNTVSVGFMNMEYVDGDNYENVELTKNELLEISIVPIPANPNAIVLAARDGLISKKDATFLAKAMEKELEGLRKLKESDNNIDMEQLQQLLDEKLQPINDKLAKLDEAVEGVAELKEVVENIKTDVATLQDAGDGDGAGDNEDGKGGDGDGGDGTDGKPGDKPGGTDGEGDEEVDPEDLTEEQAQQVTDAVAAALADEDGDGGDES